MNLKNKCAWIVSAVNVHPQTFCGAPTGFVMARDVETEQLVRVYHTYCPKHLDAATKDDECDGVS